MHFLRFILNQIKREAILNSVKGSICEFVNGKSHSLRPAQTCWASNFRIKTGQDYLRQHLHIFVLADSPTFLLCLTYDMNGEHSNSCSGLVDVVDMNAAKKYCHFLCISDLYCSPVIDCWRSRLGMKQVKKNHISFIFSKHFI